MHTENAVLKSSLNLYVLIENLQKLLGRLTKNIDKANTSLLGRLLAGSKIPL